MAEKTGKEGQEPWSKPIMDRMPHGVDMEVPNGIAKYEGQRPDIGTWEYVGGEFRRVAEWPKGNRTAE